MIRSNRTVLRLLGLAFVVVPASFHQTAGVLKAEQVSYQMTLGANVIANPNYLTSCLGRGYDNSVNCTDAVLTAINNARAQEGISAMVLPANYLDLSPIEQLFIVINLERTARGLAPAVAMTTQLDLAAQMGAESNSDPQISNAALSWGSDWALGEPNVLATDYIWMYDDGFGSPNIACASPSSAGCWGHRKNILASFGTGPIYAGAGYSIAANQMNSISLVLASSLASPSDQVSLYWSQTGSGKPTPQPAAPKESPIASTSPAASPTNVQQSNVPSPTSNDSTIETTVLPRSTANTVPTVPAVTTTTNAYSFGSVDWMIERYGGTISFLAG